MLKNDEIDFDLVKRWITVCKTEHDSKCDGHETDNTPAKRLIDVDSSCIVDCSTVKEYLTLSYVWGMAAQFMLTKDVVEDSRNKGFFESLGTKIPQSIRDAMQVCRNIGVRHLRVDALCIVQDDDEDKKDQIGLMDEIYGHCKELYGEYFQPRRHYNTRRFRTLHLTRIGSEGVTIRR